MLLDGVKLGDVNGDDIISIYDVTQIQRHLAEYELLQGIYDHVADVNGDGFIDINDATDLQKYLAEYEMEYAIGTPVTN